MDFPSTALFAATLEYSPAAGIAFCPEKQYSLCNQRVPWPIGLQPVDNMSVHAHSCSKVTHSA